LAVVPVWGAEAEVRDGIAITAEVVEQTYCSGMPPGGVNLKRLPPDAVTLRLKVRLSYRNVSAHPIIFFRNAVEQIVISQSLDDAVRGRNQSPIRFRKVQMMYGTRDRATLETEKPTLPLFDILPPVPNGPSQFDILYDVGFQVHNPSERGPAAELVGKTVFFQLDLNHARLPKKIARELEVKWRAYGTFWAERIRTEPTELNIPRAPETMKCKSEIQID
jgi:hypothetical protein